MPQTTAHSPRKFFWPLCAGMVILFIAYILALGTDFFDIAPEVYPEMQPRGKSGASIDIEKVFAASPAFQRWKAADTDAFDRELPTASEIRDMISGKKKANLPAVANWLFRAHLAHRAIDEICSHPARWHEEYDAITDVSPSSDLRTLQNDIAVLGLFNLTNRGQGMSLSRAQARLTNRARDRDNNIIEGLTTLTLDTVLCYKALRDIRWATWTQDEAVLREIAGMVHLPQSVSDRRLANCVAGEFRYHIATLAQMRKKFLDEGPFHDWSSNDSDERKEHLAWWWTLYRLQPNRFAREIRPHFADYLATLPAPAVGRNRLPPVEEPNWVDYVLPWPNSGARNFFDTFSNVYAKTVETSDRTSATARLTEIVVALARYRLANDQKLPSSLADLIPVYLPSVPLDPFDGLPLRYHPEKQLIWSIGANLTDELGGFDKTATTSIPGLHVRQGDADLVIELDKIFAPRHNPPGK